MMKISFDEEHETDTYASGLLPSLVAKETFEADGEMSTRILEPLVDSFFVLKWVMEMRILEPLVECCSAMMLEMDLRRPPLPAPPAPPPPLLRQRQCAVDEVVDPRRPLRPQVVLHASQAFQCNLPTL